MNDINEVSTPVTRTLIPEDQRLSHTTQLFGAHFPLQLEPIIYGTTDRMAEDYSGGFWRFWHLGNGGFYMAPEANQVYKVSCDNYWSGELSADALGRSCGL